jgi:pyrroline-5-carboxylate reductase
LRNHLQPGQILVSVAAGVRLRVLAEHVPPGVRVVRAMPNVGAALGASMTALVAGAGADTGIEEARAVFSAIGEVALLADESQLDAATALAASGPAFLLLALEALADGGVQAGLPRDIARRMASQAMKATALLAQESGKHTAELKDSIASPAGTTMAGLSVLEARGTRGAFLDAVDAATRRARELGEK